MKNWFFSDQGVVLTAILLTLTVLAESILTSWAPYFIIYAVLAIVIPLWLKTYTFHSFYQVFCNNRYFIMVIFLLTVIWDLGIMTWLVDQILTHLSLSTDPYYSLNAALQLLAEKAGKRFDITADHAIMLYALFILLWAPIGEELYYRGYMQGVLRKKHSFLYAAMISAAFFGIRHATHLFFLWPLLPVGAMAFWVISAFVFGLLMSYLYEKTNSLYPPILIHFMVNFIAIVFSV